MKFKINSLIVITFIIIASAFFINRARLFGHTFDWVAGVSLLAAFVASMGIFSIFHYRKLSKKATTYFMCFAAGVLISVSLLYIIPKSVQMNQFGGFLTLGGFLFLFFINRIINFYSQKQTAFALVAVFGIGFHSLVDGIVYAVTFQASVIMGIIAAIGMVTHEFTEGVITYSVLQESGVKEKMASVYAFLVAAITTPIGAFIAYPFINHLEPKNLGLLVGISAGAILYVGASHLLPAATEEGKTHSYLAFLGGVLLALFIVFTKIH